ncbi:MAG: hypothetical protein JWM21_3034 [Acidobacteria bacterium]|nr:hypothetical protein [Acidobacteriota bacterium]
MTCFMPGNCRLAACSTKLDRLYHSFENLTSVRCYRRKQIDEFWIASFTSPDFYLLK